MEIIDRFLNRITMYRLVVYALSILSGLGIIFAFMGRLSSSPTEMVISLVILIVSAYTTDRILGRIFKTPTNMESALITALILFLIVHSADSLASGLALLLAGSVSSASKFLLSWNNKHIFNPAALAAAVVSLTGLQSTTWWVGSSVFWPVTLILGLAIVRKIRRFPLYMTFIAISIVTQLLVFVLQHQPLATNMKHALVASPLLFLAGVMLTEPATMPPRRNQQLLFGSLVAVLYITGWQFGPFIIYPEVALLIGNIYAFVVSPKFKVKLRLQEIQQISDQVYNYIFVPDRRFAFIPGQYMEWTLPGVPYDSRGNRRTFTIASSPTEETIQIGLKYYHPASMYKATFQQLQPGDVIYGSQLAGNFTLNGHEHKKLAFIAGGIGITPFRSMITYLTDHNLATDAILLYVVSDPTEFAYVAECKRAAQVGIKTVPIVTNPSVQAPGVVTGKLSAEIISTWVPDYAERLFYVSGPNSMVDATKYYLQSLGVDQLHIKTDHFSGY